MHEVVLERDAQRLAQEGFRLVRPMTEDEALRVQGAREDGGQRTGLCDVEGELDRSARLARGCRRRNGACQAVRRAWRRPRRARRAASTANASSMSCDGLVDATAHPDGQRRVLPPPAHGRASRRPRRRARMPRVGGARPRRGGPPCAQARPRARGGARVRAARRRARPRSRMRAGRPRARRALPRALLPARASRARVALISAASSSSGAARCASSRWAAMTSAISSASMPDSLERYAAAARCLAFRSRRPSVSYATRWTRAWRKPYWPRSGERGSVSRTSISLRTSEARSGSSVPPRPARRGRRARVARTSCRAPPRSGAAGARRLERPSSRAAISACSVSGTSSVARSPVTAYPVSARSSSPRSSSIRTVSTA